MSSSAPCPPDITFEGLETLWLNMGTLCNLTCQNCYMDSSPTNKTLSYLSLDEALSALDQARDLNAPLRRLGFTGGEPFMNPQVIDMIEEGFARGLEILILTNAMKPMAKRMVDLERLLKTYGQQMILRVSFDHYTQERHELERGKMTWETALAGLKWLVNTGFHVEISARLLKDEAGLPMESEDELRAGFAALFEQRMIKLDAHDSQILRCFSDISKEDISEDLEPNKERLDNKPPPNNKPMCATSRMLIRRSADERAVFMACPLIAYDTDFEMGSRLGEAQNAVSPTHETCRQFCLHHKNGGEQNGY